MNPDREPIPFWATCAAIALAFGAGWLAHRNAPLPPVERIFLYPDAPPIDVRRHVRAATAAALSSAVPAFDAEDCQITCRRDILPPEE